MEALCAEITESHVYPDGLRQFHPLVSTSLPHEDPPTCAEDVIITAEFQRRKIRPENSAVELAGLKHLANFLSDSPFIVFNELATVLIQACGAGSAGITLEERRRGTDTLQCVGAAGELASEQLEWAARHSPFGAVIDTWRAELFRRPQSFYTAMRQDSAPIEELLVVPWELTSGRRGALWLSHHEPQRHFDPEDLRLVTSFGDFAKHTLQRSHSEETRRSCETLASAARVANQLAHEVNNPLQALINSLYLIAPAPHDEHVREAQLQAERVAQLVRTVLELKREPEPVSTKRS